MYVTITRIPTPGVAFSRGRPEKIRGVPYVSAVVPLIYIHIFRRRGKYRNARICGIRGRRVTRAVSSFCPVRELTKLITCHSYNV